MDIRSFKNADIDRKNAEKKCARCGWRFEDEEQIHYRDNSTFPLCPACYDEMTEEEGAFAEGGEELLEKVRQTRLELFGRADGTGQNADMVSAEIVEDEKEVYGVCDCCGMEGKFFGEEGDDWTCPTCAYGNCSCDNTSDEEGGKELLVCLYCGRDENECAEQTEEEKNPITDWCGGWGMSCDDCYYEHHPVCCKCGEESDQKGNPNSKVQLYDGEWYCGRCYEEEGRCEDCGEKDTDECRPDCPYQIKAQIKHLLADLDRVEGRGGVQRFITEELRYLF